MKKCPKRIMSALLVVVMLLALIPTQAFAASSEIEFKGYVTYGATTVGHFEVNGQQAFCLEHAKSSPQTGASNSTSIYDDSRIIACLYYGITGPGNIFGDDWERGTVVTSLVLSAIYSGTKTTYTYTGFSELLALAEAGEYPSYEASFSTSNPSVYVDGEIQRTENITLNADTSNQVSFSLPSEITCYNITTGAVQTGGSVTIRGGETFYLSASRDYDVTFSTGELEGSLKEWQSVIVYTDGSSYQDLTYGQWSESGDTVSLTATFEARNGELSIIKTSEDGIVEGLQFRITGEGVDETVTTGADGTISIDLMPGTYTIYEVSTPNRYVEPESQTVTVSSGQTTTVSFNNALKCFSITLTKVDAETGTAQGDASLAGAVYGLYNDGELVDAFTTDANGQFTSGYYLCGSDWTIKEISPSESYTLDETEYNVGAEPENYTIATSSIKLTVTEQVKKGNVSIIKHTDDGSTQIETPEEGAVFEIYLKSAGSYENAADTERDILTCDADGYAESKDLPYGVYTVHQVSGWDGRELIADFDVYISEDGETYRYIINNSNYSSYLKVVKVDSETGEKITYSGAGFQIYDPSGNLVTMTYTYPTLSTVDTFYTNDEGYLITPEKLDYGTGYTLVEAEAPYGYVVDSTPITFDVVQSNSTEESGISVIEIVKSNTPQKGTITINKSGETLTGFEENEDGTYTPIYTETALAGATYQITAAEDIYTQDGTLRAKAGEVVAEITTSEDGTATSGELYLGKYTITEITAPDGMVIDSESQTVELTYAGQGIAVTETSTSFYNERQKVSISLAKEAETLDDQTYNPYSEITFGLYTREAITDVDGNVLIEADSLIEVIYLYEDGNGEVQTDLPFGSYYIKELTTGTGYILDETEYDIVFECAGQDIDTVEISVNDGVPITNELMRGSIKIVKTSEDDKIEGISFRVSVITDIGTTYDEVFETDENGEIVIENLLIGEYQITEVENDSTVGYITQESQSITVEYNTEAVAEFENILMRGDLVIIKTAEALDGTNTVEITTDMEGEESSTDTTETEKTDMDLSGFEFQVTGASVSGVEYSETFVTDETGRIEITDLLVGEYTITELESDQTVGYVLPESQTVTVAMDEITEVYVHNAIIRGSLKVIKTDGDGNRLDGAKFGLYDGDGTLVQEFTIESDGEILIEGIAYSDYTIRELEAPDGYELNDTEYSFSIEENKQLVEITVTNEATPENSKSGDTPKTGDDRTLPYAALIISGAGIITIIGVSIYKRRKRKKLQSKNSEE